MPFDFRALSVACDNFCSFISKSIFTLLRSAKKYTPPGGLATYTFCKKQILYIPRMNSGSLDVYRIWFESCDFIQRCLENLFLKIHVHFFFLGLIRYVCIPVTKISLCFLRCHQSENKIAQWTNMAFQVWKHTCVSFQI